jgi:Chaperone of endosialidase
MKTTTSTICNSINNSLLRCAFIIMPFVLMCVATLPGARAVSPPPDGGYPGGNTAEGTDALLSLSSGTNNTAIGADALANNVSGNDNTAVGFQALLLATGNHNTAVGSEALFFDTSGHDNTATGFQALLNNTGGIENVASGAFALINNQTGDFNTATGTGALQANIGGDANTATGTAALSDNTSGINNTANGVNALFFNTTGHDNTADGLNALLNNRGSNNIAVGSQAGSNLTTGSNNIDIGALGSAGEANTIRLGRPGTQTRTFIAGIRGVTVPSGVGVIVGSNHQLGTVQSSKRFKEAIEPMDKTSEAILALKPVSFRYKHEFDPDRIPQFGLVAEDVEKVNPDLVVRDENGDLSSVRYEAVNAMLLNEFLKEHRKNEEQQATITDLKAEIATLAAMVKEQDAKIERVNDKVELSKPAPQTVLND